MKLRECLSAVLRCCRRAEVCCRAPACSEGQTLLWQGLHAHLAGHRCRVLAVAALPCSSLSVEVDYWNGLRHRAAVFAARWDWDCARAVAETVGCHEDRACRVTAAAGRLNDAQAARVPAIQLPHMLSSAIHRTSWSCGAGCVQASCCDASQTFRNSCDQQQLAACSEQKPCSVPTLTILEVCRALCKGRKLA